MPPNYWKIGKKQHFICSNLTLFIVPFFVFYLSFSEQRRSHRRGRRERNHEDICRPGWPPWMSLAVELATSANPSLSVWCGHISWRQIQAAPQHSAHAAAGPSSRHRRHTTTSCSSLGDCLQRHSRVSLSNPTSRTSGLSEFDAAGRSKNETARRLAQISLVDCRGQRQGLPPKTALV